MKKMFLLLFISIITCCNNKELTYKEAEAKLKTAMLDYLYKQVNYDSSQVKYNVLNVIFFEEKDRYLCEFKVHLKEGRHDTTGIMTADITKDFATVKRKS